MKICRYGVRMLIGLFVLSTGASLYAEWPQWGQNAQHTGYLPNVEGQALNRIQRMFPVDPQVNPNGIIAIHYASPLVDDDGNYYMPYIERRTSGTYRFVRKYNRAGDIVWSYLSDYVKPPAVWEPVFHPALANGALYVPGARGAFNVVNLTDGTLQSTITPYDIPDDPDVRQQLLTTVYVAGVPTVKSDGTIFYTILSQPNNPLGLDSLLVQVNPDGTTATANFADLTGDDQQKAPLNAGPAIAPNGTIYIVSTRRSGIQDWLVAVNPDLTPKWLGSLSADPARMARVIDQSSSCPVVGPDGRVFYGGWNTNQLSAGYLYQFSSDGEFLGSFDFGWDITPAIYPDPDGNPSHYYLVQKYNRYAERRYFMIALDPNTRPYMSIVWQWELVGREWCINGPAIDKNGNVYTNGEDGFLYRIPWGAQNVTRIMLDRARDAAYTPLALGSDGTVYTLNNGRLFLVGN